MNYRPSSTYDGVTSQQNHYEWKYFKMKMHLIHLIHQTSQLSLGYLKHPQNTYISLQLGKIIQHKAYFIMRCWLCHVTYWILYWKRKTERLAGGRRDVCVQVADPRAHIADGELWLRLPRIRREDRTAYHEPGKTSKFKLWSTVPAEYVSLEHHGEVESSHHH